MILMRVLLVTNEITYKATFRFLHSRVHRERTPHINRRFREAETVYYC